MIDTEKAASNTGAYTPKIFSAAISTRLCNRCASRSFRRIRTAGGATEAGAPEFIDLLTSENPQYQLTLGGGLMWPRLHMCGPTRERLSRLHHQQRTEMLDLIAYRKNIAQDASLSQGVAFFSFLRNLTADEFFTSKIGIQYLGYIGNGYLAEFPGCPPVPGV